MSKYRHTDTQELEATEEKSTQKQTNVEKENGGYLLQPSNHVKFPSSVVQPWFKSKSVGLVPVISTIQAVKESKEQKLITK